MRNQGCGSTIKDIKFKYYNVQYGHEIANTILCHSAVFVFNKFLICCMIIIHDICCYWAG